MSFDYIDPHDEELMERVERARLGPIDPDNLELDSDDELEECALDEADGGEPESVRGSGTVRP